jgi:hypothetical protein
MAALPHAVMGFRRQSCYRAPMTGHKLMDGHVFLDSPIHVI